MAVVAAGGVVPAASAAGSMPGSSPTGGLGPVGVTTRTFVDRSRRTPSDPVAGIPPARRRVLPTTIYYPARRGGVPGAVTPGAPPVRGRRPLVLFSPGAPGFPADYEVLLADWAAHGYVVAAVEFPVSSVSGPDPVAWKDLPAQTGDVREVLDALLDLDPARSGVPPIDEGRIAAAGHSFGGATALSLASPCCRDERVRAVVALAAVTDTEHGPRLRRPTGPVLFVHARNDRLVPYAAAAATCRRARAPKRFLTIEGIRGLRAHVAPYVGDDEYSDVVRPAIVDFLDGYVRGDASARGRLDAAGAGTAVAAVGRCRPGEPVPSSSSTTTGSTPTPSTPASR